MGFSLAAAKGRNHYSARRALHEAGAKVLAARYDLDDGRVEFLT